MTFKNYIVLANQSIRDIAIQEYGDITGMFWIVEDNNLDSITQQLTDKQVLLIRIDDPGINNEVVSALKQPICTAEDSCFCGIGFMQIGSTFIIN